jgi:hypothetical protein
MEIDTDKYEGHSPAPWEIHGERICAQDACKIGNVGGEIATVIEEINTHLIADAPLLLEAFKHLRVIYEELYLDWRKVWDTLDNMGMAKEMRQHFPNTFLDTMEMIE